MMLPRHKETAFSQRGVDLCRCGKRTLPVATGAQNEGIVLIGADGLLVSPLAAECQPATVTGFSPCFCAIRSSSRRVIWSLRWLTKRRHGQRLNALRDQIAGKLTCIGGADSQLSNAARAANGTADTRQRVPLQREQIALGNDPGQRTITVNNNDMAEAVSQPSAMQRRWRWRGQAACSPMMQR
jgi:hypothetical protein